MKLYVVDFVVQLLDFWHIIDKMREVERLERLGHRVFNHSDCATGVDDEDFWSR